MTEAATGTSGATKAARERLHGLIDGHVEALRTFLKSQADALLEHAEAVAREVAASRPAEDGARIYNRKEVAQMLACSEGTVDRLAKRGLLKSTRRWSGGPKCFLRSHVEQYLEGRGGQTKDGRT
jgi:excisionase family DNA binding protein